MAARTGCAYLIQQVRNLTGAGTADYIAGTASLWDDDQVQILLDNHRRDYERYPVPSVPRHLSGGTLQYLRYELPFGNIEGTASGTAVTFLEDAAGADVTAYTSDFQKGIFTFTADTLGTAYYFTGRQFDVHGAAADLLDQWAAKMKLEFDFSTSGLKYERSQKLKQILEMSEKCRQFQWVESLEMRRNDAC